MIIFELSLWLGLHFYQYSNIRALPGYLVDNNSTTYKKKRKINDEHMDYETHKFYNLREILNASMHLLDFTSVHVIGCKVSSA